MDNYENVLKLFMEGGSDYTANSGSRGSFGNSCRDLKSTPSSFTGRSGPSLRRRLSDGPRSKICLSRGNLPAKKP